MYVSLKHFAASAVTALALVAVPASALADDTPKPGTTGPGDVPAEALKRMSNQRPLTKAADVIMDAIDAELAANKGSGYTSLVLGEKSVILRYKGKLSAQVQTAVDEAGKDVTVTVLPAKHSRHQLEQAAEKVKQKLKAQPDAAVTVVLPSEGDKLRVEVKGDVKKTREALPDVGMPVDVVAGEMLDHTGRMDDYAPYYGGGRINRNGGGFCTAGFGVKGGGRDYILTAGHCGNVGDWFSNGNWTRWLGSVEHEDRYHDMLLISAPAGQRIFDSWIGSSATRYVAGWGHVYPNEWLCAAGSVTGAVCDIYADTSIYSYCYNGECYGSLMRGRQAQGRTVSQPGDSGGPLYNLYGPNYSQALAKGIISGRTDSTGSTVIFQDFGTVNWQWGVTPK